MCGFLRPLLVWLLLLSMPLQAWSAATMAVCGTDHARPAFAGSTGGHGGAAPHHGARRSAAAAEPSAGPVSAEASNAGHAAHGALPPDAGCSACAACFHGAVPSGAESAVAPARLRSPLFAWALVLPVQNCGDVPERPPRARVG